MMFGLCVKAELDYNVFMIILTIGLRSIWKNLKSVFGEKAIKIKNEI